MIDCQKILDSSQKVDVDVKIDTNINNGLLVCGECSLLPLPACLSHHICGNQATTLTLKTILINILNFSDKNHQKEETSLIAERYKQIVM